MSGRTRSSFVERDPRERVQTKARSRAPGALGPGPSISRVFDAMLMASAVFLGSALLLGNGGCARDDAARAEMSRLSRVLERVREVAPARRGERLGELESFVCVETCAVAHRCRDVYRTEARLFDELGRLRQAEGASRAELDALERALGRSAEDVETCIDAEFAARRRLGLDR